MAKILFITTYKSRDLHGNVLVGYYLTRKYGHEVIYTNAYGIQQKMMKIQPDMLVVDHLVWDFKVRDLKFARKNGMKTAFLPTEGLIFKEDGILRNIGLHHNGSEQLDLLMVWGNNHKRVYHENKIPNFEKTLVTGCPRFDYYVEPYKYLSPTRKELCERWDIPNPEAPLLLWATNTPYNGWNKEEIVRRYISRSDYSEQWIRDYYDDNVEQFQNHLDAVSYLAEKHPDWNIVVKVHPAELAQPYQERVEQYPNLFLAPNSRIQDFLLNCDVLLQRNCTTATEAWLLGKPVMQIQVGEYKISWSALHDEANEVVRSMEELDASVQEYLAGKEVPEEIQKVRENFISEYFYKVDGRSAIRVAQALHEQLSPPHYSAEQSAKTRAKLKTAYEGWEKAESSRLPNRIKDLLGIERDKSLRLWKKIKKSSNKVVDKISEGEAEATPEEIAEIYGQLDKLLKSENQLHPQVS